MHTVGRQGGGEPPPPLTHARTGPKLRGPLIDPAEHMSGKKLGVRRLFFMCKIVIFMYKNQFLYIIIMLKIVYL